MKQLLARLEHAFDSVVIDAPPLLPVTDAAVLSQHVGGVVLVVGAQKITEQDLDKALNSLKMVGATLLGVVVNRLPAKGPDSYAYSYYRHEDEPVPVSTPAGRGRIMRDGNQNSRAVTAFDSVLTEPDHPSRTFRRR
jgi:Mrp family chromosome partitioning ATPase